MRLTRISAAISNGYMPKRKLGKPRVNIPSLPLLEGLGAGWPLPPEHEGNDPKTAPNLRTVRAQGTRSK
jgi:hypothetical protein